MTQKSMLAEGLADAIGFVVGALMGFWLGKLLGLNIFDPGYSNSSLVAIGLAGLGGGKGGNLIQPSSVAGVMGGVLRAALGLSF